MSTTAPVPVLELGPVEQLRAGRLPRRLAHLAVGLVLYGVSLALMVRAGTGLAPWDVLHSGFVRHVPITLGQAVVLFSFLVLVLWIPLRERPGLATIANAIVVGLAADATLAVLEAPDALAARVVLLAGGIVLCAFATALYIGAGLGRGPRDGLMTGLHRRTGLSLRLVRTCLELAVVLVGLTLGGAIGVGTIAYALAIGPLAQAMMPHLLVELPGAGAAAGAGSRTAQETSLDAA